MFYQQWVIHAKCFNASTFLSQFLCLH